MSTPVIFKHYCSIFKYPNANDLSNVIVYEYYNLQDIPMLKLLYTTVSVKIFSTLNFEQFPSSNLNKGKYFI